MTNVIEIKNLTVQYQDVTILHDINFEITKGEIVAIIGPNGSGKTTLLKAILGLVPKVSGQIKILGKSIGNVFGHVAYVPQKFEFDKNFPITVKEFLEISCRKSKGNSEKMVQSLLTHVEMERSMNKLLGNLSGGELQRVIIERSMLNKPEVLFLDEPASGIDITGEKEFYEILRHINREHNTTIVMVSHEIDLVYQYATQVICLNRGFMCFGKPTEVLNLENMKKLFGEKVSPHIHK